VGVENGKWQIGGGQGRGLALISAIKSTSSADRSKSSGRELSLLCSPRCL